MGIDETTALSLLGGVEFDDPRLYSLLDLLIRDFYALNRQINPPTTQSTLESGIQVGSIGNVTGFSYQLYTNNVRISWLAVFGAASYEVKYKAGTANDTDWTNSNSILQTTGLAADINPLTIPLTFGKHSFLIKAISGTGIYSPQASVITIEILELTAPTISAVVIDNNVLLSWIAPVSQFEIVLYNVYKNAVKIGTMKGTFEAIFEVVAGTFVYGVEAVDMVGNIGERGFLSVDVKSPPDYALQDKRKSSLNGTRVNVEKKLDYLLCNINTTETWGQHFATRSWANIQAQINAGFPIYAQPTVLTGSYEEVIDYGAVLTNNIVTIRWSEEDIVGDVTVVSKIASSTDGINYTPFVIATTAYYASLRYIKLRFEFTAHNTTELLKFSNLEILLDVKREVDSGQITALLADGLTGTVVNFNKVFKDVDSIELTVAARQPITAIYRFNDIPNPVFFNVLAFDSSGNQVDYLVSWMARGVV